jgi:hypothetical protein
MRCAAITRISKNAAPARLAAWAIALRILRPPSMRKRAIADQVKSSSIDADQPASDGRGGHEHRPRSCAGRNASPVHARLASAVPISDRCLDTKVGNTGNVISFAQPNTNVVCHSQALSGVRAHTATRKHSRKWVLWARRLRTSSSRHCRARASNIVTASWVILSTGSHTAFPKARSSG